MLSSQSSLFVVTEKQLVKQLVIGKSPLAC